MAISKDPRDYPREFDRQYFPDTYNFIENSLIEELNNNCFICGKAGTPKYISFRECQKYICGSDACINMVILREL